MRLPPPPASAPLLFTCPSFIPCRKMTASGGRALPNGAMSSGRGPAFAAMPNRICRQIWAFMTCGWPKRGQHKLRWPGRRDCRAFAITTIGSAFADPRYVRVDARPAFAVYNADDLPCPRRWCDTFRDEVQRAIGTQPYLIRVERYLDTDTRPPAALGFDAALEFQPFSRNFWRTFDRHYDMAAFTAFDICQDAPDYTCFPGVCPSWDNSARRPPGKGMIFRGSSPRLFGDWLAAKAHAFQPPSSTENLLFINAWNEWAEGNHLEPCLRHGHNWLKACRHTLLSELDALTACR